MLRRRGLWPRIRGSISRLPGDLILVVLVTVFVNAVVFLPVLRETPLRIVLGLAFVTVIPGYALVSALFPEADHSWFRTGEDPHTRAATDRWDISGVERAALSLGLSISVVPLVGIGLNFTSWGIQLVPIMAVLSAFTLSATVVAVYRRLSLPPSERFQVQLFPYRLWLDRMRSPGTRLGALLNLTLLTGVLLAAGSVGFALATPSPADGTTEFYLLAENEDGELVAADYPEDLVAGTPARLTVGIDNMEFEPVEYTVVVQLQEVERTDDETRVLRRSRLDRIEVSIDEGESWRRTHDITPRMTGENLRVQYLLYRGTPPEDPTAETAYRTLHLWVDVAPPDGESAGRLAASQSRTTNRGSDTEP